jgi:hypothetical protein
MLPVEKALSKIGMKKEATHIEIKRSTNDRKEPQNLIKPTDATMVPYLLVLDQRMD